MFRPVGPFFGGWSLTPFLFSMNLLVRVKLGYPPYFNFLGKPLLGEKERKKKEEGRKKNNANFSGHYVRPRTHNVRAHGLHSHQLIQYLQGEKPEPSQIQLSNNLFNPKHGHNDGIFIIKCTKCLSLVN